MKAAQCGLETVSMKLPDIIAKLVRPKPEKQEFFVSLLLDEESVSLASWYPKTSGKPHLVAFATKALTEDSWDERTKMTDRALTDVEDKSSVSAPISKVVLGLPAAYLTENGNIQKSVAPHIRELTKKLVLKPVGFVPVHQAIAYMLKREDGVPASVILISVSGAALTISLYRVGALTGQKVIPRDEELVEKVEKVLRAFQDNEVLPSRILLYGTDGKTVEEVKSLLLNHPWTTRANFLHFPKIEILPDDFPAGAVCYAACGELASEMKEEETDKPADNQEEKPTPVEPAAGREEEEIQKEEKKEKQKEEHPVEEESNVVMVEPEALGFEKDDILEKQPEKPQLAPTSKLALHLPKAPLTEILSRAIRIIERLKALFSDGRSIGFVAVLGIIVIAGILYWALPKVYVTVLVSPKKIEQKAVLTVDPKASAVDTESRTIPGSRVEQSVSGEKTLAVSGKKNVGDPAKGTVAMYNKSTTTRLWKKGTILSAGSLKFTLDADVQVASASVTGSVLSETKTFGKADAAVTAADVGSQSNMPANTEFTLKDVSSDVAIARNSEALTGGTSREVTVVSRADSDAVFKALTDDLVKKAKEELAGSLGGGQKLIDSTIETSASEKTIDKEIDQEAQAITGKMTLVVSGITYKEEDGEGLLTALFQDQVPEGYEFSTGRTAVDVALSKQTKKKDSTIMLDATLRSVAVPIVDTAALQQKLAGKTVSQATTELRGKNGIVGVEYLFRWSWWKSRLPMRSGNISISVSEL